MHWSKTNGLVPEVSIWKEGCNIAFLVWRNNTILFGYHLKMKSLSNL